MSTITLIAPKPENLTKNQRRFLDALVARLKSAGMRVAAEAPASAGIDLRLDATRGSDGVVVLAFEQWEAHRTSRQSTREVILPSEFAHIGCVLACAARRPLLVLRERSIASRGALRNGYVVSNINLPRSLDEAWLSSAEFRGEFDAWAKQVSEQQDVFLGYSSQAADVGERLKVFLADKVGVRVFDWHAFRPGDAIWDSIRRAERLTKCGVFLFMEDDAIVARAGQELAPRDNVVYEAGYFAGAKGLSQTLIVREERAKIPTDLGGVIYLQLGGRRSLRSIERSLKEAVTRMVVAKPAARANT